MPNPPVPYTPDVERIAGDEAEIEAELIETLLGISRRTWQDTGRSFRSVHAKSHALLKGELHILDTLPPLLAQGLFAREASYPVVMRFSTTPGDILPDSVSTPRGLAIKVVGVAGERMEGSEGDVTQDFVMTNAKAFQAANGKAFLSGLKLLAATTDKATGMKVAMSKVMRGAENVIETFGGKSAVVRGMGGEPRTHPLGETYYTGVPVLYGDYIAKLSLVPVSPELTELTGARIDVAHSKTPIRDAMIDHFSLFGGEWELRVQLCTDLDAMPVENAAKAWPETLSPFVTVARITVPPQTAWSEERSAAIDEGMSFSPWHGLAAHRPLGSINRLRRMAYAASARFRMERAGKVVKEPETLQGLFDDDGDTADERAEVFYP